VKRVPRGRISCATISNAAASSCCVHDVWPHRIVAGILLSGTSGILLWRGAWHGGLPLQQLGMGHWQPADVADAHAQDDAPSANTEAMTTMKPSTFPSFRFLHVALGVQNRRLSVEDPSMGKRSIVIC